MLQRIYGVTFPSQKELDEHLERLEEAKKRDHRKIGQEMELFLLTPKVEGVCRYGCRKGRYCAKRWNRS